MNGDFVGGFVLGVVVGAAVTLVAVARRGPQALDLVAQGAGQLRDRAGGLVDQVRQVRGEANGPVAPVIEREIDEHDEPNDRVIHTAAGMQ